MHLTNVRKCRSHFCYFKSLTTITLPFGLEIPPALAHLQTHYFHSPRKQYQEKCLNSAVRFLLSRKRNGCVSEDDWALKTKYLSSYLASEECDQRDITQPLTAFPRAVQEVERPFHPLPVLEVEKGVGDSFAVASLQDVLWRQDQALCLQQVLQQAERGH